MQGIDLTEQRFGYWVVKRKTNRRTKDGSIKWFCECDCGTKRNVSSYMLRSGKSKSCGCRNKGKNNKNFKNLTGKTFGRIFVAHYLGTNKHGTATYLCKCSCGKWFTTTSSRLGTGRKVSCGCYKTEIFVERNKKYENPKDAAISIIYKNYKRKNIVFDLSIEDVSYIIQRKCKYCGGGFDNKQKTSRGFILDYTGIDRIDSTKGYIKDNVVSCCKQCNRAKNNLTLKEFNNWLDQLVKYRTEQYKLPKAHISKYTQIGNIYCGYKSLEVN